MKTNSILLSLILVILIIAGVVLYTTNRASYVPASGGTSTGENAYCTQDALMCPDGSYVGRIPPSCNFAQCPVTASTTATTTQKASVTIGIGQTAQSSGLSLTPLAVVEDSRCPVDVNCIQAGRVRLDVRVNTESSSTTQTFTLNTPLLFGLTTVTLSGVTPERRSTTTIATSTYRFIFSLTHAQ